MSCALFYFDYNEALHLANFDDSKDKMDLFAKITDMKRVVDNVLEDFIWKLNEFLEEQNRDIVKKTDVRLASIPLTSKESTPLVHRSKGYCSASQFDLIAYTFLEELDIEVRDHNEFLEAIWWTHEVGKGFSIDKSFEKENTRRPVKISMNLGETLILH